jgi:catechol 2,3-dioxygenase
MTASRTAILPAMTTLGPVRLQVADLDRSVGYYRDVLGLRVGESAGGRATLLAEHDALPLLVLEARPGAAPMPRRARLGLYHFAILLPDRAALGRFVSHLDRSGVRAGASDHLVSEALYLTDPDGLGIEVYADRPRAAWQWREGELVMATNPLNLDSLVAVAGGTEWSGMPAGTRVGHVHLHVGSLPEGEAFYGGALGLEATARSYPGALFLSAGGYHHHLGINTWAGPMAVAPSPGDARLLEWNVILPDEADVATAAGRVRAMGYPVRQVEGGWLLTDPWGTELRLTSATGNPRG